MSYCSCNEGSDLHIYIGMDGRFNCVRCNYLPSNPSKEYIDSWWKIFDTASEVLNYIIDNNFIVTIHARAELAYESGEDGTDFKRLRKAGCTCEWPLLGYHRYNEGLYPRCRMCNVEFIPERKRNNMYLAKVVNILKELDKGLIKYPQVYIVSSDDFTFLEIFLTFV